MTANTTMPAMIAISRDVPMLLASIYGFLVPLAALTFRPGAGVGQILGALFIRPCERRAHDETVRACYEATGARARSNEGR